METDEMIEFVKALSHADRLRVLGVLAKKEASASEISDTLGMPLREVVQHLAMLAHGGIVREQDETWSLDIKNVENISARQFKDQPREAYAPSPDLSEKPRKILAAYLKADGSIKQIPSEAGKLQVILNYLLEAFTPGVIYTEKEVNMIIRRFHLDTAGLRRDMIDRGMLQRKSDGSQYWRPE
jgi:hypothetical protein